MRTVYPTPTRTVLNLNLTPGNLPLYLDGGLRRKDRSEHVDVENLVELFFGHSYDRSEFVNTRVIDEDVETAVVLYRRIDDALRLAI